MLVPRQQEHALRAQMIAAADANIHKEIGQKLMADGLSLAADTIEEREAISWFFGYLRDTPKPADMVDKAKLNYPHGLAAGIILWKFARAGAGNTTIGAIANEIVNKLQHKMMSDGKRIRLGYDYIVDTIWPRYRSVAHLWAAYYDGADASPSCPFPCAAASVPTFLAGAESFRAFGERTTPSHSDSTLLSPLDSWRLPETIIAILPPVALRSFES